MHRKLWSILKLLCGHYHLQQDHKQVVDFVLESFEVKLSVLWHVISVVGWLTQSVSDLSRHEGEGSRRCSISDEIGC